MGVEPKKSQGHLADEFAELWRAEVRQLLIFCRRRVDGDRVDADEVLSTTALCAWRSFGSLRDRERFGPWVRQIAAREAIRASRRRRIALLKEMVLTDEYDVVPAEDSHAPSVPKEALSVLAREALERGLLSSTEATVVAARLSSPEDAGWDKVSADLDRDKDACALHWMRAVPKLRVFMLLARPNLVGGRAAIGDAYERALSDKRKPLLPLEAEAFRHEILERRPPLRRDGWKEAVRSAAANIVRHLQVDPLVF